MKTSARSSGIRWKKKYVAPSVVVATALSPLRIAFGTDEAGVFDTGVPVLAGDPLENLFGAARRVGRMGAFALYQTGDWLLGVASVSAGSDLENASLRLYQDIFQATQGWHLARIWNYVPDINKTGTAGLENYRLFCRGRSVAFEEKYGAGFKAEMPSASAVGSISSMLTVAFAASRIQPRHHENPLQVPAYDYPVEYGPRPPSFSRATVVPGPDAATVFVSGTAAIRGHSIVAAHSTSRQLTCTLENLREISRACGLGSDLDRGGRSARHIKVYVRHASDQPLVAASLKTDLFTNADNVVYLQADICRASLLVEIEVSLFGVTGLL